jgi:PAS domain S-box-containing protein
MNPALPPASPQISLPPEQFAATFPFHLAVDQNLIVQQAGATLRRICPDIRPGAALDQIFRSIRPEGSITHAWVLQNRARFFLLEHRTNRLQLRGEFLLLGDTGQLLFLGSPWFTDAAEIAQRGLGFEDFAIHDPVVDMLQVYQANKLALADAKKLAGKLTAQRAALRSSNERLQQQEVETRKLALIAARTDNAVVLTDATGHVVWVNEGFTRITGYSMAEMLGKRPGTLLQGPGTDTATVRRMSAHLARGEGFSEEILNYGKHGRSYWLAVEVQPIHDAEGRLMNFMAVESDITVRRLTQQRLAIQLEVSRVLAEARDFATAFPTVLQAICENLGWQVGELWHRRGDQLHREEFWHPPLASVAGFSTASSALAFPEGMGLPGRIWADRRPIWISDVTSDPKFLRGNEARAAGLRGAFGFPVLVRGELWGVLVFFSTNIEDPNEELLKTFGAVGNQIGQFIVRREAEEALHTTITLQNAILTGANYSIISSTPDGIIQLFNSAAERMLGYTAAELVGRQTPALFHDAAEVGARARELTLELGREVVPGFEAFVAKAELGQPDEREWTYIRKDGTRFPVLLSITALFDELGRITGYLGIASDLTLRKRDEEKLRATLTELERFNRVMLHREERVLELKREINQLRDAAGQPPAYASVGGPPGSRPGQE